MKYFIERNLILREDSLPKGFYLKTFPEGGGQIVVPSDIPGDEYPLYEEEITGNLFKICYDDGVPVSTEDGELLGTAV